MKTSPNSPGGRACLTWLAAISLLSVAGVSWTQAAGPLVLDPAPAVTMRSREQVAINDVRSLPDGGILVAGDFQYADDTWRQALAKLQIDGTVDPAFPYFTVDGSFMQALPDASGRIVVAGYFREINGIACNGLARLLPDGSVDASFVGDPIEAGPPFYLHPAPDGGFFIASYRYDPLVYSAGAFARKYDATGRYDASFPGIQLDTYPISWAASASGDLAVCRYAPNYAGHNVVSRFDSSGQAVPVEIPADFNPLGVAFDSDGSLVLAGQSLASGRMLVRILPGGFPDPAFDGMSPSANLTGEKVVCLRGGEIFVKCAQGGSSLEAWVARFSATGAPLGTLRVEGMSGVHAINLELTALADGDCALRGVFDTVNGVVAPTFAKVAPDGQVRDFLVDLTSVGSVTEIVPFGNGAKLIGGYFTEVSGAVAGNLAVVDRDGGIGTNVPLIPFGVMQAFGTADGGAVVLGGFSPFEGTGTTGLVKVLPSGMVDTNFLAGVQTFGFQSGTGLPNGSAIVTGYFGTFDPTLGVRNVMRVGLDGRIDTSFIPPQLSGPRNVDVMAAGADPAGRIVIAGSFVSAQGQPRPGIARFLGDGQLDPEFAPAIGLNVDTRLPMQLTACANGDVYVMGIRGDDAGERYQLLRFRGNGSIDETSAAAFRELEVSAYVKEPNDSLIVAVQRQPGYVAELVRLSPEGVVDPSLSVTFGAWSYVQCMALDPSGRLWIGGSFREVNGQPREGVASFSPAPLLAVSIDGPAARELPLLGSVILQAKTTGVTSDARYQWYHDGRPIRWARGERLPLVLVTPRDAGQYTVSVTQGEAAATSEPVRISVAPRRPR